MTNNKQLSLVTLLTAILFFVLGLIYPILKSVDVLDLTKTEWFSWIGKVNMSDESSIRLIDSIDLFLSDNHYFLALLIVLFTILFPIVKFIVLLNNYFNLFKVSQKTSLFLEKLDKYSMLDVFLVAIFLMIFKLGSGLLTKDIELAIGTLFIAISVVLRMLSTTLINIEKE